MPTAKINMKPSIGSRMKLNSRLRRVLCLVLSALLVTVLIRLFLSSRTLPHLSLRRPDLFYWKTTSRFNPVSLAAPKWAPNAYLCRSFPHRAIAELVHPVFRTGHLDAPDRLGAQFSSVSACFEPGELLVISDMDEVLAGHHAYDVLARLPDVYRKDSPDFANYTYLKMLHTQHKLDQNKSPTDKQGPQINGWMIDKFKFLPMVELAWQLHPNKPWYFFYESDTYVVWDNLFRFLENLDPDVPLYLGSPTPGESLNETTKSWFAYGGAGFALNRGAMEKVLEPGLSGDGKKITLSQRWEDRVRHNCCGDSVLGWALLQASVGLSGFWPHFNPHSLLDIPYSASHWCQPVLTMHKTDPEDMVELWRWEQSRRENNVRPQQIHHDTYLQNSHHCRDPFYTAIFSNTWCMKRHVSVIRKWIGIMAPGVHTNWRKQ